MRLWRQKLFISIISVVVILMFSALFAEAEANMETLKVRARGGYDIETLDPAFLMGNEEHNINLAIFSRLVEFDHKNPEELKLDAAKEFEVREEGTEIYFELKEGIEFHEDYGEMTAEDVKFSFERFVDPEIDSPYREDFGPLQEVEIIDRYRGKIILSEPYPGLLERTLPLFSGAILSKEAFEDKGQDEFATNPVGSGPYKFTDWQPGEKIVLSEFENYHGENPEFSQIEIYPIEEEEAAEIAFDTGELDETRISLEARDRYKEEPDVSVHELNMLRFEWLGFNHMQSPFDDRRVRKAIRYAVNVDEVIRGAYDGAARRANTLIPPEVTGHWEDAPEYEQNLERARELLKEAGYEDGFSTELASYAVPVHLTASQIIQHNLAQIGIDVQINTLEGGEFYEVVSDTSYPGMHFMGYSMVPDPGYWTEWYSAEQIGSWNYLQWDHEEFNELHQQASVTVDDDKREEKYIRMQEIMDEEVAFVPISYDAALQVARNPIDPAYLFHYTLYKEFDVK